MKLDASDLTELRPLIAAAATAAVDHYRQNEAKLSDKLGMTEPNAAAAIGVERHVLRDCRLRGEIKARKVGSRYIYSRDALLAFLNEGGAAR